jgi:hypothetical protein
MNIQDVLHTIHSMDKADAARVLDAARMRVDYVSRAGITVGSTVQFDAGNRGIITGKVIKVNIKRTKVRAGSTTWNVSHSLLDEVADATA